MGLDGQSDPKSIHGGCEVLSGEKWGLMDSQIQRAYMEDVKFCLERNGQLLNG
ncbi:hypothetical protein F2Q69_00017916 [Brassica cretica]|uniref:Prolyl 4-hydroxylase alpha subunit Fe(2+) 2OG dioxygenase domain-containing protein n=1 Tax=Brassica cretica TaxID=69181 RepID=A0A8S9R2G5_BRACR|nr:hypothetical protein F2Q69_00017916 [Brassica cretica]